MYSIVGISKSLLKIILTEKSKKQHWNSPFMETAFAVAISIRDFPKGTEIWIERQKEFQKYQASFPKRAEI